MIKFSKKNSRIETERLILRQPNKADIKDIIRNLNDLEVSKWMAAIPYPYTRKDVLWFINHAREKAKAKPRIGYNFWIELKETGEVIGGIGMGIKLDQGTGSLGYWLGRSYHRKGYGSESLKALLDLAFRRLKIRRLEAEVYPGNPSSAKLLKKFGFKREGYRREAHICKADGKIKDSICYALLKHEYKPWRRK